MKSKSIVTKCHQIPAPASAAGRALLDTVLLCNLTASNLAYYQTLTLTDVLLLRHARQKKLRGRGLHPAADRHRQHCCLGACCRRAAIHLLMLLRPAAIYPATFFGVHCQYLRPRNMQLLVEVMCAMVWSCALLHHASAAQCMVQMPLVMISAAVAETGACQRAGQHTV